ncbi:MAG: porin [Alphaproteobacteria bacterium]|nr:porin [Alphaproteobacteria bacterium]
MKKVLFGTTALVAAGMFGSAAQAAEPIKLSVGGFMNQWFAIADVEDKTNPATQYNNLSIVSDTEVHFKGSTVLDNGLKVAVVIELEAERTSGATARNADQQYAEISGGWGAVSIGERFNAAQRVHTSAPGAGAAFADIAGMNSQAGGANLASGAAVTSMSNYYTSVDGIVNAGRNSTAIDYVSPMFGPFAFGVTYTPAVGSRGLAVEGASVKDLMGAALVYADKWGPVSVNADVAYARAEHETLDTQNGMLHGIPVGLKFGYAGFEVGGSYFRIMDNVKTTASGGSATAASFDGRAWDAGIAYTTGPWKFGYQYFSSHMEGLVNTKGKDKTGIHNGGGQYTMGPGVVVTANVGYQTYRDEAANAGASNNDLGKRNTLSLVTGLRLNF